MRDTLTISGIHVHTSLHLFTMSYRHDCGTHAFLSVADVKKCQIMQKQVCENSHSLPLIISLGLVLPRSLKSGSTVYCGWEDR